MDLDADPPVVTALISGRERIPAVQVMEIDNAVKIVPGNPEPHRGWRLGRTARHRQDPWSRPCA
ncbi:hypothetical protein AB0P21_38910 [Kribbella sp. NPDC056861]|uniref:hypothetical protein n=1 Tax=Kribbella sp. NPDC056861 TaxID=3154857 RepID=UPI00344AA94C